MPKISQSLGFTFRMGPQEFSNWGRVDLEISDIDTSLPIEPQLKETKEALNEIWKFIYFAVDKEVEKIQEK